MNIFMDFLIAQLHEALESGLCDAIKIRLNRRDGRRSGKWERKPQKKANMYLALINSLVNKFKANS